jgi:hypothetical protein
MFRALEAEERFVLGGYRSGLASRSGEESQPCTGLALECTAGPNGASARGFYLREAPEKRVSHGGQGVTEDF